jgi:phosphoglucosamine mutase
MLSSAVASGICSAGCDVQDAGLIPTPAVAYLTRIRGAAAGVVISASHNPYEDNGIKLFDHDGRKLSKAQERAIEALILKPKDESTTIAGNRIGTIEACDDAAPGYRTFLRQTLADAFTLKGMRLVLDCANGATAHIAPALFLSLGAELTVLGDRPDGININADCGSEHTQALQKAVVAEGAHAGLAFDGDGDRLIAADETGRVLSGDEILVIAAKCLQSSNRLDNDVVVSTIMSNLGLAEALGRLGIRHATCQVGDREVMEKMVATNAVLGGENSGHMIFRHHHSTGDGILSALKLLEAMVTEDSPLSKLAGAMQAYPQVLKNVAVRHKPELKGLEAVQQAIATVEERLKERGRVLVRYSGTQAMCRVMVEGHDEREAREGCDLIAEAVAGLIGR